MKISFLNVKWYSDFQRYKYTIRVDHALFSTVLTVITHSDNDSPLAIQSQKQRFRLAFRGFPKNYIDPSMYAVRPFLENQFGKSMVKIVDSVPLDVPPLCLKDERETKKVASNKIRPNGKLTGNGRHREILSKSK